MPKEFYCYLCQKRVKTCRRSIPYQHRTTAEQTLGRPLHDGDVVCDACRYRSYRSKPLEPLGIISPNTNVGPPTETSTNIKSPKSVVLNIDSTPRSHKKCVICKINPGERALQVVIPSLAITQAFVERGIYINSDSRCCKCHLDNGYLTTPSLDMLKATKDSEQLSRTDIASLLKNVRSFLQSSSHINFDVPSALRDEDYKNLTGLSRDQFSTLTTYLTSMRNTAARTVRTSLAVFLSKLRTGLSNSILATLFGMTISQVQRVIPAVRVCLMDKFVPQNLGFQHISHSDFALNHTTPIAKALFTSNTNSDEAVLVMDGTYIYIKKSSDYSFQRKSYSMHKNRPLVKPMMIVGTDGYILSVIGPYFADYGNNDANIVKHMFNNNVEDMKSWLNEDKDVVLVDRGFRDCIDFLNEKGYRTEMPYFLPKGRKQHTTEEANLSRLVTKVRWVVESANGRIKQWKLLDKTLPNTLIPQIGDFVRIVCALCNRFRPPLANMDPETEVIANKMRQKFRTTTNSVQQFVEENNLKKLRSVYKSVEAANDELADFPVLSLSYLRDITFGIYQLKQSVHYSLEHLSEDGSYDLLVCKNSPFLLHAKIQSRHSKNTVHLLWIRYCTDTSDAITGWYCTCKIGARVVGCCAHVSSVLWYLGYQRRQDQPLVKKSSFSRYLQNATDSVCQEE